ncbi:MAG: hypothetical protein NXH80_05335 [Rhodobacteraceae bacterium]|nr:hypothetical protein [Paracoccaceae bacterium]
MSIRYIAKQRRTWVQDYITKNAPVTVKQVAEAGLEHGLKGLTSEDAQKAYWVISKDILKLRKDKKIPLGSIIYRQLQED